MAEELPQVRQLHVRLMVEQLLFRQLLPEPEEQPHRLLKKVELLQPEEPQVQTLAEQQPGLHQNLRLQIIQEY